jgi:membrane protein CcdC involved in cytochrome C biogenesis
MFDSDVSYGSVLAAVIGTLAILAWRIRESQRPITVRGIVIPPLGMSTGFSMFVVPAFRVPWLWGAAAFALGALLFAYPLMASTTLTREGEVVMMRRSRAFIAILLGLAAVRFALRRQVGQIISPQQTAGLFYILAFGMIVRWRSRMYVQYRQLVEAPER